jgi:hypothetical protein
VVRTLLWPLALLVGCYLLIAYFLVPGVWQRRERRHPALVGVPRITRTGADIPGDPLNIALVGSETHLMESMLAADWSPADPITLRSSLRIAQSTVFRRPYVDAPVSNLFLFGRKQDLALEQPDGNDARRRHHVRFWRSAQLDEQGRPLWVGSATHDVSVGLSHTTGQITHHIGPDVDAERDKILADLGRVKHLLSVDWIDGFQEPPEGRNGGGDPWHTDGRLGVGTLTN